MIVRVIVLARSADIASAAPSCNDASCATVSSTASGDGIFAVVATRSHWQPLLVIAEDRTVLAVGEGAAPLDEGKRFACFARQGRRLNGLNGLDAVIRTRMTCRYKTRGENR